MITASDCVGCPSGGSSAVPVLVGVIAVLAGVAGWAPLGRLGGPAGRSVAALATACGLALIVLGA
ncbi:MAG TPA: hypothetical protein VFP61_08245 [Acidimicrobiales bacterium]|nr:hypothetical protein [Acidimicrobiales bacterium]